MLYIQEISVYKSYVHREKTDEQQQDKKECSHGRLSQVKGGRCTPDQENVIGNQSKN